MSSMQKEKIQTALSRGEDMPPRNSPEDFYLVFGKVPDVLVALDRYERDIARAFQQRPTERNAQVNPTANTAANTTASTRGQAPANVPTSATNSGQRTYMSALTRPAQQPPQQPAQQPPQQRTTLNSAPRIRVGEYIAAKRVSTELLDEAPEISRREGLGAPKEAFPFLPRPVPPEKSEWNYGKQKNGEPNNGALWPSRYGLESTPNPGFCYRHHFTMGQCRYTNGTCRWSHERPSQHWCSAMVNSGRCSQKMIDWILQCCDSSQELSEPRERYTVPRYDEYGCTLFAEKKSGHRSEGTNNPRNEAKASTGQSTNYEAKASDEKLVSSLGLCHMTIVGLTKLSVYLRASDHTMYKNTDELKRPSFCLQSSLIPKLT
jgi:hypothetical protein